MKLELPEIRPEDRTPLVESLLAIIRIQQDRIEQLEETVRQLRDEIAILKGQKPRPQIAPSRLEHGVSCIFRCAHRAANRTDTIYAQIELTLFTQIELTLFTSPFTDTIYTIYTIYATRKQDWHDFPISRLSVLRHPIFPKCRRGHSLRTLSPQLRCPLNFRGRSKNTSPIPTAASGFPSPTKQSSYPLLHDLRIKNRTDTINLHH
jgi:hypothetical protein